MTKRTYLTLSVIIVLVGILSPVPRVHGAFIRGDVDASGEMNLVDAVRVFRFLFLGVQVDCANAVDANDDGALDATDGIHVISYIFLNGAPPAPPFPDCGEDPTEHEWSCNRFAPCQGSSGGFFYVIDRSSSSRNGELQKAKELVVGSITELSSAVRFGVVFFDAEVRKFPADGRPAIASQENKDAAIAWVNSTQSGYASCILDGLLAALLFANSSTARRNLIIYMGDGGTTCVAVNQTTYPNLTLTEVRAQNFKRHQINTIKIGSDDEGAKSAFLKQLADQNGGSFSIVAK